MTPAGLYGLCDPAFYYFLISFIIIIVVALQNFGQGFNYCVGTQSCPTSNVTLLFVIKIFYILVWTWILNLICKNGYEPISWVLVLIPIILMLIFMAFYVSNHYDFSRLFTLPSIFN
jgi:hypothetical protein